MDRVKNVDAFVSHSHHDIDFIENHSMELDWGRFEFSVAYDAAIVERRSRIIVIKYGDIDENIEVDPEIKAYLTTNTYIEWGDPIFFWSDAKQWTLLSELKITKISN